jgi:hypothetical protein
MLKDLEKKLTIIQNELLDKAIKKWEGIENKKATKSVIRGARQPNMNRMVQ